MQDIQKSRLEEMSPREVVADILQKIESFDGDTGAALKLAEVIATVPSQAEHEALIKLLAKKTKIRATTLTAHVRKAFQSLQKKQYSASISDWWDQLGFETPSEYSISADGVLKYGEKSTEQLTTDPVWVQALVHNLSTGTKEVELAWRNPQLQTVIVPVSDIYQKTEFIRLVSDHTIPLRPGHFLNFTNYVADFMKANQTLLNQTTKHLSRKPGWTSIPDSAEQVFAVYSNQVMFRPTSSMQSAEKHLRAKGTIDDWLKLRPCIEKSKMLAFFMAAALSAPLLELLGASGFCVDQYGDSSTGKTTTSRLCASMFGKPGGQTGDGLVAPWHSTPTYIEEMLGFYSHLPVFVMDSQDLKEEAIERVAYMVANGQGKGRGAKDGGVRSRNEWRSVLLSDGESSMYERLSKNGAKARVISIHGAGCSDLDASDIFLINAVIAENYGSIAPEFIRKAQEIAIHGAYSEAQRYFGDKAKSAIEKRVSGYFAIITVAARVLCHVSGFDWFRDVAGPAIEAAWQTATEEIDEELPTKTVLRKIADFVTTRRQNFVSNSAAVAPAAGQYLGRIVNGEYVAFVHAELEKFLKSIDVVSPKLLLKAWMSSGVIDSVNGQYRKQVRMQGRQASAVCFRWEALFPSEPEYDLVPDTSKVVQLPNFTGLMSAKGRVLDVCEVIRDGAPVTMVRIEGHSLLYAEDAVAEKLSQIQVGKDSEDFIQAHYRMTGHGDWIKYIEIIPRQVNTIRGASC